MSPWIFRSFRELLFLHKNNTMAVLLKTASVRVSFIQIMQVRVQNKGKSVWKSRYIGDVSPSLYRPSGNGCADRFPILGVAFLRTTTTNKPGAINPNNFCLLGLFFPRNYYSSLFYHLYIGLSNDVRTNDGHVVVRSVSIHSPANAASGTRTDL